MPTKILVYVLRKYFQSFGLGVLRHVGRGMQIEPPNLDLCYRELEKPQPKTPKPSN